jgi:hypothetical protein
MIGDPDVDPECEVDYRPGIAEEATTFELGASHP